jgi:hypothetical protein
VELTGDELDRTLLRTAIANYDQLLVDGLSFYLLRISVFLSGIGGRSRRPTAALVRLLSRVQTAVTVVDAPLTVETPLSLRHLIRTVHAAVIYASSELYLVEDGNERPVSREELLRFEHGLHATAPDARIRHLGRGLT